MKNKYDFLVVFNTCGIRVNNTFQYIKSIQSILNSNCDHNFKLVISSCLNSEDCRNTLKQHFGDKIEIVCTDLPLTVNITFNKTCIRMIEKYGQFKGYLYIDSGVDFVNSPNALNNAFCSFLKNDYGILSIQTNDDHGIENSKGASFPVRDKDYIIPLGGSVNGHVDLFSNDIFLKYGKLWPDVFAAYCTESTFTFLASSVNKRWAILKDEIVNHIKSIDGPSLSSPHFSLVNKTPWNNLLFGRNALDFINDSECIESGLGYEECNKVMLHNKDSYDLQGNCKNKDKLIAVIKKYFYLNEKEIDYSKI